MNIKEFEKLLITDMLLGKSEAFRTLRIQYELARVEYYKFMDNEIIIGFLIGGDPQPIGIGVTTIANWDYRDKSEGSAYDSDEVALYLSLASGFMRELKICYSGKPLNLDSNSDYSDIYRKYAKNMKNRRRVQARKDEPNFDNNLDEKLFADDICANYSIHNINGL
jgi:hypothetical protein